MKILLINQNAIVEKLVRLSAQRIGLELTIADSLGTATDGYEWLLVDHESLGGETIATLRAKFPSAKIGLLYPKTGGKLDGFDLYIEKPFLPTELIDEFSSKMKAAELPTGDGLGDGLGAGDLGDLGDLGSLDDLGALDDLGSLDDPLGDLSSLDDSGTGDLGGAGVSAKVDEVEPLEPLAKTGAKTADAVVDLGDLDDLGDLNDLADLGGLNDLGAEPISSEAAIEPTESIEFDSEIKPLDDFAPEPAQEPISQEPADLGGLDDLGDLGAIEETPAKIDEPALDELALDEPALNEPAGVLDMGEIQEVKGLIDEINEPAAASEPAIEPITEAQEPQEAAFDEDFGDIFEDGKDAGQGAAELGEELNLDFGENSALLDDDDLAAIRQQPQTQTENLSFDGIAESQEFDSETADLAQDDLAQADLAQDDLAQFDEPKERFATPDFGEIPAFAESSAGDEELSTITEPEVAAALGEELPFVEPEIVPIEPTLPIAEEFGEEFQEEFKQDFQDEFKEDFKDDFKIDEIDEPLESVREIAPETALTQSEQKAVAGSITSALSTLSPSTLREVLDGMQLTINISFPKK